MGREGAQMAVPIRLQGAFLPQAHGGGCQQWQCSSVNDPQLDSCGAGATTCSSKGRRERCSPMAPPTPCCSPVTFPKMVYCRLQWSARSSVTKNWEPLVSRLFCGRGGRPGAGAALGWPSNVPSLSEVQHATCRRGAAGHASGEQLGTLPQDLGGSSKPLAPDWRRPPGPGG